MIKWLVLIAAGYFLFRLLTNDRKKKGESEAKTQAKEQERKIANGEMVKDPVCGAYVDKDSGITVRDGDTVHVFCSYECREQFLERVRKGENVIDDKQAERVETQAQPEVEKVQTK